MEAFRTLRSNVGGGSPSALEGLDWERFSAEMAANIHVGLAAGRCVPPLEKESVAGWAWRPVAVVAALTVVVTAAWWLNVPASDRAALYRVMRGLPVHAIEDHGPVVAATSEGIEFRENGSSLGVGLSGAQLVETSLSVGGSASARYVDDDADQVTITAVYVQ
jgi:hypothetical protein